MPTKTDIAMTLAQDSRPSSSDGASNMDRVNFIMEVFGCESLDLDAHYDFQNIIACKDLDTVEACKHLALLKMQYAKECVDYGLMEPLDADIQIAFLTLNVQRMNWHLEHLSMGRRTPPFPGLQ